MVNSISKVPGRTSFRDVEIFIAWSKVETFCEVTGLKLDHLGPNDDYWTKHRPPALRTDKHTAHS